MKSIRVVVFVALSAGLPSGTAGAQPSLPLEESTTWFDGRIERPIWLDSAQVVVFDSPNQPPMESGEMIEHLESVFPRSRIESRGPAYALVGVTDPLTLENMETRLAAVPQERRIQRLGLVFHAQPGTPHKGQQALAERAPMILTEEIIVRFRENPSAGELKSLLGRHRLKTVRTLPTLPNTYLFRAAGAAQALRAANAIHRDGGVLLSQPNWYQPIAPRLTPSDPLFPSQWHLSNTGQGGGLAGADARTVNAWNAFTGSAGEVIAIVDDGLEIGHADLAANILAGQSYDYLQADGDPTAGLHGTSVAGVAAAVGNNGQGGAGAAFGARLVGYRLLDAFTDANAADALGRNPQIVDIYNNSWGPTDNAGLAPMPALVEASLQQGVTTGRGGRGNVFVFAGGNGGESDDANYDGYANSRYVIAVGASTNLDIHAVYADRCACLRVVAPSNGGSLGITTTDRSGSQGYDPTDYTGAFGGTSSAAPLVSGVVALMLQANPELTWLDVQRILMSTAEPIDPGDSDWATNGAGFMVNHRYGFGRIDAEAAVTAAQDWPSYPPAQVEIRSSSPNIPIPEAGGPPVSDTVNISQDLRIDFVEVVFTAADHTWAPDLTIELISPQGTISRLATSYGDSWGIWNNWRFGSARHFGEHSSGDWTLRVQDLWAQDVGTFQSWELRIHGTAFGNEKNLAADANLDGIIDIKDAQTALGGLVGAQPASKVSPLALINGSGTLDIGAVLKIGQISNAIPGVAVDVPAGFLDLTPSLVPTLADNQGVQTFGWAADSPFAAVLKTQGLRGEFSIPTPGAESTLSPASNLVTAGQITGGIDPVNTSASPFPMQIRIDVDVYDPAGSVVIENVNALLFTSVEPAVCGNAILQTGETCDDGNTVDDCACRSGCTLPYCGDGRSCGSEECDDGGNADPCDGCKGSTCQDILLTGCGDKQVCGAEVCDDGDPTLCAGDCNGFCTGTYTAVCGNGAIECGEYCDDGNTSGGDGCDFQCVSEIAADFPFFEPWEDGVINGFWELYLTGGGLAQVRSDLAPIGGRHLVMLNITPTNALKETTLTIDLAGQTDVQMEFWVKGFNEELTALPANWIGHSNGDGVSFSADGNQWFKLYAPAAAWPSGYERVVIDLDQAVTAAGKTFNGLFKIRFQTYDDQLLPNDGLAFDNIRLYTPGCGDGITNAPLEFCDDGPFNGSCGYCTSNCLRVQPTCGDGIVECGEPCDDGNVLACGGTCNGTCTGTYPFTCGDGVLECGEQCDDGNLIPGDYCTPICTAAATAPYPFYDGFDTGEMRAYWTLYSSAAAGRVEARTDNGPIGTAHAVLHNTSAVNVLNELELRIDLAGQSNVLLSFKVKEFNEDSTAFTGSFTGHKNGDGIAISNNGVTYYPIRQLGNETATYGQVTINLDQAAAAAGILYSSNFRIRFQQYDNEMLPNDGLAFDDIRLDDSVCGNSTVEGNEICDDGNTADCDGCNATCTRIDDVCGDAFLECGEVCEDGNTFPCAGACSETCSFFYPVTCGDGVLECGEQCDDGNAVTGDGCDAACLAEPVAAFPFFDGFEQNQLFAYWTPYTSAAAGRVQTRQDLLPIGNVHAVLHNTGTTNVLNEMTLTINLAGQSDVLIGFQVKEFNEDANAMPAAFTGHGNSDGVAFSANGTNWYRLTSLGSETASYQEVIFDLDAAVAGAGLTYTAAFQIRFQQFDNETLPNDGLAFDNVRLFLRGCGNGVVDPGEACDDGNTDPCDGCHSDCLRFGPVCGDTIAECAEACDDGNSFPCAGLCDETCGGLYPVVNGNGVVECGEECDDGNAVDGDGCASNGIFEAVAPYPFYDGFETTRLFAYWSSYASTAAGHIEARTDNGPIGAAHALLYNTSAVNVLTELELRIDLSGRSNVLLTFSEKEFNEDSSVFTGSFTGHKNGDGIAVSNNGVTYYPIHQLGSESNLYGPIVINLDQAAASAGITYSNDFHIRFQQYDNEPLPNDGLAFDEIRVRPTVCGDGVAEGNEVCDDGNTAGCDGCDATCSRIDDVCGDGLVECGEFCDDGNTFPCAGPCDAVCAAFTTAPSTCGDGVTDCGEQCDDGNAVVGDGCDAAPHCQDGAPCLLDADCAGHGGDQTCRYGCLYEPIAAFPFYDGFETTQMFSYWTRYNSAAGGVTAVTQSLGPQGIAHAILYSTVALNRLNEMELAINLAGRSSVFLAFDVKEFSEDVSTMPVSFSGHSNSDGVAISADGTTWYRVRQLGNETGSYQTVTIDLDAEILAAGIAYDGDFRIRFQQYDNELLPNDGLAFDNIRVFSPVCGNGFLEPGELCDDGNTDNCDACSPNCLRVPDVCGDGISECGEVCDDGNDFPCAGSCNETCAAIYPINCGNAVLQCGEACDDGNADAGDGCGSACRFESVANFPFYDGFETREIHPYFTPYVSNPLIGRAEARSDNGPIGGAHAMFYNAGAGNALNELTLAVDMLGVADAILSFQAKEFAETANTMPATFTGHGNYDGIAISADGNNWSRIYQLGNETAAYAPVFLNLDQAAQAAGLFPYPPILYIRFQQYATTVLPAGGIALDDLRLYPSVCGDGITEGNEFCDDANTDGCDGCHSDCRRITNLCGDGIAECGEFCDDANTFPCGGPCATNCTALYPVACGNGVVQCGEECDDGNAAAGDGCDDRPQCEDGTLCSTNAECIGHGGNELCSRGCVFESVARFPFLDGFETRLLHAYWATYASSANGRAEARSDFGPIGNAHAVLHNIGGTNTLNELTLTIDLAGRRDVVLSFDVKEFVEESTALTGTWVNHKNGDGVAVSADGLNWYAIRQLGNENSFYGTIQLDLDAAVEAVGLAYNAAFRIRFQQYDDQVLPDDGLAFDNIRLFTPSCGDGIAEFGEECDDANSNPCDGCNGNLCRFNGVFGCGDGVVCAPETCDDGDAGVCKGACNETCTALYVGAVCGDGVVQCGEICDQGAANGPGQWNCAADCSGYFNFTQLTPNRSTTQPIIASGRLSGDGLRAYIVSREDWFSTGFSQTEVFGLKTDATDFHQVTNHGGGSTTILMDAGYNGNRLIYVDDANGTGIAYNLYSIGYAGYTVAAPVLVNTVSASPMLFLSGVMADGLDRAVFSATTAAFGGAPPGSWLHEARITTPPSLRKFVAYAPASDEYAFALGLNQDGSRIAFTTDALGTGSELEAYHIRRNETDLARLHPADPSHDYYSLGLNGDGTAAYILQSDGGFPLETLSFLSNTVPPSSPATWLGPVLGKLDNFQVAPRQNRIFFGFGGDPLLPTSTSANNVYSVNGDGTGLMQWTESSVADSIRLLDISSNGSTVLVSAEENLSTISSGGEHFFLLTVLPYRCGNSVLEPGEVCDDGDMDDGDGCTRFCK